MRVAGFVAAVMIFGSSSLVLAEDVTTFELTLQQQTFSPSELKVPAGKPFKLKLKNANAEPAEFESKALKFEKIVAGSGEIVVNVRPLAAGRYEFVDEYHEDKAKGFIIAE
jgi:hypothetical protein